MTQFVKPENRFWLQTEFNDLSEALECQFVPCELNLKDIYRSVNFL